MKRKKGRSQTPTTKIDHNASIEIEKPLHERIREEFERQIKEEDQRILEERKKQQEFHSKYSVDYQEHMLEHRRLLKQKLKEYEQKRMKRLEELGLKDGRIS